MSISTFEKVYIVAGRAAVAGAVGGLASTMLFGASFDSSISTFVGRVSQPVAFGVAVASAQVLGEGIHMLIPEGNRQSWNTTLYGFLSPALTAAAGVGVAKMMFPGSSFEGWGKLALLAGGSAIVGDYAANKFLIPIAMRS